MQVTHALNLFHSLHTMVAMESLKRLIAVPHSSPRITFPRTTRQHPSHDSIQTPGCQQQSQQ